MALKDFEETYEVERKKKNIVFCIYQEERNDSRRNSVNYSLEFIQKRLAEEYGDGIEYNKAFVFGENLVYAKDFKDTRPNQIYYADYCRKSALLSHIWLMGLVLLEKKAKEDKTCRTENFLYLFTNTEFPRVEVQKILSAGRFDDFKFTPVLVKDWEEDMGMLEEYIRKRGKVLFIGR